MSISQKGIDAIDLDHVSWHMHMIGRPFRLTLSAVNPVTNILIPILQVV